ncbi:hypothetical protein M758_4G062400 [Ceratodon purpureus]|nr:hypothetical protein M758_4G062400 [Ceratodon purpureus]
MYLILFLFCCLPKWKAKMGCKQQGQVDLALHNHVVIYYNHHEAKRSFQFHSSFCSLRRGLNVEL